MQPSCPWNMRAYVQPYLQHYLEMTSLYTSEDWDDPVFAFENHTDLQRVLELIKCRSDWPKSELIAECFKNHSHGPQLSVSCKNQALDLALSAITMVPFLKETDIITSIRLLPRKPGRTINPLTQPCKTPSGLGGRSQIPECAQ